jgi:hypothetical protein
MLLFYDLVGIVLELDFRVVGENIRVFQISGKSRWSLGAVSEGNREEYSLPGVEGFKSSSVAMPIDFKGLGSQCARGRRRSMR